MLVAIADGNPQGRSVLVMGRRRIRRRALEPLDERFEVRFQGVEIDCHRPKRGHDIPDARHLRQVHGLRQSDGAFIHFRIDPFLELDHQDGIASRDNTKCHDLAANAARHVASAAEDRRLA